MPVIAVVILGDHRFEDAAAFGSTRAIAARSGVQSRIFDMRFGLAADQAIGERADRYRRRTDLRVNLVAAKVTGGDR